MDALPQRRQPETRRRHHHVRSRAGTARSAATRCAQAAERPTARRRTDHHARRSRGDGSVEDLHRTARTGVHQRGSSVVSLLRAGCTNGVVGALRPCGCCIQCVRGFMARGCGRRIRRESGAAVDFWFGRHAVDGRRRVREWWYRRKLVGTHRCAVALAAANERCDESRPTDHHRVRWGALVDWLGRERDGCRPGDRARRRGWSPHGGFGARHVPCLEPGGSGARVCGGGDGRNHEPRRHRRTGWHRLIRSRARRVVPRRRGLRRGCAVREKRATPLWRHRAGRQFYRGSAQVVVWSVRLLRARLPRRSYRKGRTHPEGGVSRRTHPGCRDLAR